MRKIILSFMLLVLCIALASCGLSNEEKAKIELHDKYEDLIGALESKDKSAAMQELLKITQNYSANEPAVETEDESVTAEKWMKELVGTWHDMNGMYDDITFRDDATCTYDGNTYSVEFETIYNSGTVIGFILKDGENTAYKVHLESDYANNGTSVDLSLMVPKNDHSSTVIGSYLCSADYNVQRDEWIDKLVGDWINDSTRISINSDGTCIIDGTTYTVRLRVNSYSDSTVYFYLVDGNAKEYKYQLQLAKDFENNGVESDAVLYTASEYVGSLYRASDFEVIELTLDNWRDYFEIVEVILFEENSFGEVAMFSYNRYYCLKDEYVNATAQHLSNIAIEYTRALYEISCVADPINRTLTLGEKVRDIQVDTKTEHMQYYSSAYYDSDFDVIRNKLGFSLIGNYQMYHRNMHSDIEYADDVVMNRIKGTLYILKQNSSF